MNKIWQKEENQVNKIIEKYNTGEDYIMDIIIMPYDIQASLAHAEMLKKINIINSKEFLEIKEGLNKLLEKYNNGEISINIEDEDCHTVIEQYLIDNIGESGKKIHTGRSRNDQVLTAIRLYLVDQLKTINSLNKEVICQFVELAEKHKETVMPGYTHTQQAMLSSVAHWSLSFAESLINDYDMIKSSININNQNPLGTAASFGVDFPLDREFTAKKLNFNNNIVNSLFAQGSRGKFESYALEAMNQVMFTLGRFASDILFFTSNELEYFYLKEDLTTGSSIMPQKKNKDSMELLRGYDSILLSNQLTVKNLIKGLISGYHRDLQHIKKPLIESVEITKDSLLVVKEHLKGLSVNKENINKSIQKNIIATDMANEMVKDGTPFREAYKKVGKELDNLKEINYENYLNSKKSLGSPGNLNIEYYKNIIKKL